MVLLPQVVADEAALSVRLEVAHGGEDDFCYEVRAAIIPCRMRRLPRPSTRPPTRPPIKAARRVFRAEVHLTEGGQDYDVMGWSEEQVIVDILNQYEDHLHFLHTVR